ncbi:hypothetical protein CXB51_036077 [Gossypium anomalum]|uniref:CCHC-type domain-containing protein n=1 Tax=Gossypium anomalum TaxID=47600 RepID=A0A8J6CJ50_9ROSI|nr:hypothetical protein CXB51_036077 [Gossypium anomalum]
MRVAICVNLNELLVAKIQIDGKLQKVEYESLPNICFECGFHGHLKENCGMTCDVEEENEKVNKNGHPKVQRKKLAEVENLGLWMIAEWKSRHRSRKD